MSPSPSKHKTFHKGPGKIFCQKERGSSESPSSSSRYSSSLQSNEGASASGSSNGSYTPIRRDEVLDLKDLPLTLPDVTPLDKAKSLSRYNALASGEGVSLEEIDGLQLELELLLSSSMVRHIVFTHQLDVISQLEKGRLPPKMPASPGKRMRMNDNDRPFKRFKDITGRPRDPLAVPGPPPSNRPSKVKCSVVKNEPLFDVPDIEPTEVPPKTSPIRNDISNRFWTMVDQYCQEITADNVKMLEDFLSTQNDDSEYMKIPPLGKHYSLRWAQEDMMDEQKESGKMLDAGGKRKLSADETDRTDHHHHRQTHGDNKLLLKEINNGGCNDDVAPMGPLTQRIVSGLVEENVLLAENGENKVQGGVGIGRPGFVKALGLGNAVSLEKKIKKELQDQGILDADNNENEDEDDDDEDEILSELKRCQAELKAVSSHNHSQLSKLLRLAREALFRHDLKKKLRDADAKVLEAYRALTGAKQKKKPTTKKEKEHAMKVLKEREVLVKQLDLLILSSSTSSCNDNDSSASVVT